MLLFPKIAICKLKPKIVAGIKGFNSRNTAQVNIPNKFDGRIL
jgi:hypothetical protein